MNELTDYRAIADFAAQFAPDPAARTDLRLGVCVSKQVGGKCTVQLGGAPLPVGNIPYLNGAVFTVGQVVIMLKSGPSYIVLGGLNSGPGDEYQNLMSGAELWQSNQATLNLTNSYLYGRRSGDQAHIYGALEASAWTGVAGNGWSFIVPAGWEMFNNASVLGQVTGSAMMLDLSAGINYVGIAYPTGTRSWAGVTNTATAIFGINPSIAGAAGDRMHINVTYRLANP